MKPANYDVIIIGAGASGLACAGALLEQGLKVLVLEARARAGGRMYTLTPKGVPLEMGAEFIHAAEPEFLKQIELAQMSFYDIGEKRYYLHNGKLSQKAEFWEEIEKVSKRLDANRKVDRSISDFFKAQGKRIKPSIKPLVVGYYSGFNAADLDLIGEKSVAALEKDDVANLNEVELFRTVEGYGRLVEYWVNAYGDPAQWLQLESVVQKIEWQKHKVKVFGSPFTEVTAKRVVITLPVGVLKSFEARSSVEIQPRPEALDKALAGVHMGHVERITFEFSERFWEDLTKEPMAFMHSVPGDDFSVWWTMWPRRTNYLVAWQGGPRAESIAQLSQPEQVELALRTLSKLTGKSLRFLKQKMKTYHIHNWASDPYSQGAYSYLGIDGAKKMARLKRPFDDTLYFAGEALAEKSGQATVHGAYLSGVKVARQILKAK